MPGSNDTERVWEVAITDQLAHAFSAANCRKKNVLTNRMCHGMIIGRVWGNYARTAMMREIAA